ncbi:dicarboxylic acid transporter PcaT [plant metagenome]|uniref:Dicarboxylic acid transporter PcaT n=1 Tax=plant metagenome TaxID=1297885 RepID=A0A484Q106_9ZZZZ
MTASAGNLIEWYDFFIYAFMALYFAAEFFPEGDRTAQLLNVAGIYAAGFLIRPLGGWYFGRFADRHGRRAGLVFSVGLMGVGALAIALLPTHAQIGAWAPLLLLLCRLLQGFSCGGQYGAAATYLSEIATDERRGFYSSFQFVTLIGGQLFALLVLIVLQQTLDEQTIRDWAWRIPFALGAVLTMCILLLRERMHETVDTTKLHVDAGRMVGLFKHPKSLGIVISLTAGGAVCIYTFTTYMQKFLVNTAGLDITTVSFIMTAAMIGFMLFQPLIGALSDKIGRRRCLLVFTGLMTVTAVPLLKGLSSADSAFVAFALVLSALGILSFYTSISGLFKAELFPPHVRALGVGFAHSISAAVFGGSTEYIALLLKSWGYESAFFWYVAAVCGVSFLTALMMREPRRDNMLE